MKSVMDHSFGKLPLVDKPRSSFDRSSGIKMTFDEDYLYPFFVDEVLPGDTFNLQTHGFVRMSTPLYPLMDNSFIETFYFFVPNRLVWDNWQKMMGEREDPDSSTDYTVPQHTGTPSEGSFLDYLGLPTGVSCTFSTFWGRAYYLIWNEWFRNQNLQDSLTVDKGDTHVTGITLQKRGKKADYFTKCLPWPAKYFEDAEINLPLGTSAPVIGIANAEGALGTPTAKSATDMRWEIDQDGTQTQTANWDYAYNTSTESEIWIRAADGSGDHPYITADLTNATAATINQLRLSIQVQRLYEADARSGTRYIEKIFSEFGVVSSDQRLQRPEFLGGGSQRMNITPIPYNAEGASASVGTLAAIGTGSFSGHGFTKSFEEHGMIIGLINVRSDITYQQGLNRMFSREDRLDYYTPTLAHLGEQAVLNKEICADGTSGDEDVFGYQEAWSEYRYKPSLVVAAFRSNASTPLDAWHLSQEFSSVPTLGDTFIKSTTPFERVVAVSSEPTFIGDFYHQLRCARVMPLYSVPGMMDHF
jgi:hypothetical protein